MVTFGSDCIKWFVFREQNSRNDVYCEVYSEMYSSH